MNFNPKTAFHKYQGGSADALRGEVEKAYFQNAIHFAMAEVMSMQPTEEMIKGVNTFVQVLCNLGEKAKEPVKLPVRTLKTFEPQPQPNVQEKK